nr:unnamed protein product [Callosobruchus chinensis]
MFGLCRQTLGKMQRVKLLRVHP